MIKYPFLMFPVNAAFELQAIPVSKLLGFGESSTAGHASFDLMHEIGRVQIERDPTTSRESSKMSLL